MYKAYSSVERKPVVDPKIIFKIIAYAYSQDIYSSRKIEKEKRNIEFVHVIGKRKTTIQKWIEQLSEYK